MEWPNFNNLKSPPIELLWFLMASFGGVARQLNNYANGVPFKMGIFVASTIMSGFSGYMFALLGQSLSLTSTLLFMMAGAGGFMGDQAMKLVVEFLTKRVTTTTITVSPGPNETTTTTKN